MRSMFEPRLEISVATSLTEQNAHGTLWVKTTVDEQPRNLRTFFILNKPQCVKNGLSFGMWHSLIKQLKKMGLQATHIEITAAEKSFCYTTDRYSEIYSGAVGQHVIRNGFA